MVGSQIFWKVYLGFALVILVTSATVWFVVSGRVTDDEVRNIRRNLVERAAALDVAFELPGSPEETAEFRRRVRAIGRSGNQRVSVIATDGVVIADSDSDPDRMENHKDRPEIRRAFETLEPESSTRYSRTVGKDLLYVAYPSVRQDEARGLWRIALPLTGVEKRLTDLRNNVLFGAATAAVVALVLGLLLSRTFTKPLTQMTEIAEGIAGGDYEQPAPRERADEFGKLGRAIDRMRGQLQERMESLTRERNGLRAILACMLEGVVAVDREERIVLLNKVAANLLNTPEADSIGKRVWELTRIQEVNDSLAEVLRDAVEHTREVRLTKAFRERVIELQAAPLKGAGGELLGAVLVLHDVTELRRLEEVRQEFVANVSHELKTPLTAIRGFVETLIDDGDVDEATRSRFLSRVKDQTLRISALVSDLLVLSRVESEEEALERGPVDLRSPVKDCSRRFAAHASDRNLRFETEIPEEAVIVLGDEEGLRQAVDNLLDNAFKYTPEGGSVRLGLHVEEQNAVIEVEDTGIGIETQHIGRIFERFYRVDKARSRELGGTGLGLAIVKHIVAAHNGEVTVRSVPSEGSRFSVVIPLHDVT
jgi:two-component system phosphate regulon sensor histidine kinase PhoR